MGTYLACLDDFSRHTHGLRRLGAAAVDLSYLACGRVDAFFEYNLQPWDVAAGGLLVQEAGGVICDFSGGNNWLFGKQVSATNGILEEEFNKIIKRYFLT
jgi:myo-inositol-1(or 4)-monophosphatase